MRRGLAIAIGMLAAVAPAASWAGPGCQCRANGQIFEQGELTCIKTNHGPKLARCDMFLNNSSWTVVRDGCPSALMTPAPAPAAELAAALDLAWAAGTTR